MIKNRIQSGKIKRTTVWLLCGGLLFFSCLTVLVTSGYMVSIGNKAGYCASCHVMVPFCNSWQRSMHGGNNRTGIVVQCIQCHLPHDGLLHFSGAKIYHTVREVVSNFSINGKRFDWSGNAARRKSSFTYDSGCLSCHQNLKPVGLSKDGVMAHNRYQLNPKTHPCTSCHAHVGHLNPMVAAEKYFFTPLEEN